MRAQLLALSQRIGRALRPDHGSALGYGIPYTEAVDLLGDIEDTLSGMAQQLPPLVTQRLVCAWCQDVIRNGELPTSHGICGGCQAKVLANADAKEWK